jgi:hypothetical protein
MHIGKLDIYAAELYSFEERQSEWTCGGTRAHYLFTKTNIYRKGKLFAVIYIPTSSMIDMDTNAPLSSDVKKYASTIKTCNNYTMKDYDKWSAFCKLKSGEFTCNSKEECIAIVKERCVP